MIPGEGSAKIRLVMAWRRRRRRLARLSVVEAAAVEREDSKLLKVAVVPSGNALGMP